MIPIGFANRAASRPAVASLVFVGLLNLVLMLAGCGRHAQPTEPLSPTSISGRVVHANDANRGVPGVLVRAVDTSYQTTTDSTGSFSFQVSLPDGKFLQLAMTKAGFTDAVTTLTVRSGAANALTAPIALSLNSSTTNPTSVSGRVVYADDPSRGLPGVLVRALGTTFWGTTDSTGWFGFQTDVAAGRFLQLAMSKAGYNDGVASLTVTAGANNALSSPVALARTTTTHPTSVSGRVVYADDPNRGLPGVLVRALDTAFGGTTDSTGWFGFQTDVADGRLLQLAMSKAGYNDGVASLTVTAGANNALSSPIALARTTGTSGVANTVVLKSASTSTIGVTHSGSSETAQLVFEVRDALGRPVDFAHRAAVQFTLTQQSGGGASLSPDTTSTDASGLAAVALNSGTRAQAVQVRAQVTGTGIHSEPVPVVIVGGLPDAAHFSFAPATLNVPGLVTYGIADRITAFVGDQYANPVPVGTVVYFSTTGGIIQGSASTDDHGRASVDFVTSDPQPNGTPALSDSAGRCRISIQTVDWKQAVITQSALAVLFSGHTELSVLPSPQTSFDIPIDGSQDFVVTVWDHEHHNPLTKGTTISFSATMGTIGGLASVVIPDTGDTLSTRFTFRIENPTTGPAILTPNRTLLRLRPSSGVGAAAMSPASASAGTGGTTGPLGVRTAQPASVTVTITSSNGNASVMVPGTVERP